MKRVVGVLSVVGVLGLAAAASANTPAQRESAMKGMGGALRSLSQAMRSETVDPAVAGRYAAEVAAVAKSMTSLFPEGAAPDGRARAEVWTNRAAFTALANDFSAQADRLLVAARAGDKAQIGSALQAVGDGCNSCHSQFRSR